MTTLPFDLVVALDRSDATAAVAVFDLTAGSLTQFEVSLAPEALEIWWTQLFNKERKSAAGRKAYDVVLMLRF